MWIRNTSRYADEEVRHRVLFAVDGIDMRGVCVNVKNGSLGGAAYNGVPEISNAPRAARFLVTLRLGRGRERWPLGPINYHFKRPDETGPRNRFPFYVCHDWGEWLVKLAAHEAKHIEQFRAKAICSELDCEHHAIARLQEWRAALQRADNRPGQLSFPGLGVAATKSDPLVPSSDRRTGPGVGVRDERAA